MADDPERPPLRGEADFAEELKTKTPEQIREELDLPNIEQILKDLQQAHGVRIGLSPKLLAQAEDAKTHGNSIIASGCPTQDICIFCDHDDLCATCDTMDWCSSSDTHIKLV